MAEFDDKLNSLLSNPEAMDQIMSMARSLMGGGSTETAPPPPAGNSDPQAPSQNGGNWQTSPENSTAPGPGPSGWTASPGNGPPWGQPANSGGTGPQNSGGGSFENASGNGPDWSVLSGLGSIDPQTIAKLLPVLRELNGPQDSNARQLLFALRPYLKPERQEKVERALQLARLFRVGKKFLLKGDLHV